MAWILDAVGCSFFYRKGFDSLPLKNVMFKINKFVSQHISKLKKLSFPIGLCTLCER
jgi:hypothetical protein